MSELIKLKKDIAASIYILPCTEEELFERDFLKNKSRYGIRRFIQNLENSNALYYKGDKMYIYKQWVKDNLKDYNLL